jgi:epoxyqueuosine reductase
LERLASLSEEEFCEALHGSAAKRTKWRGLLRNACIALGNSASVASTSSASRIVALLERLAASKDAIVADAACWARSRL